MKQVVQSVRSGDLRVVEVPRPVIGPTEVLVRTTRSVISAGTEKAVRALASASLLDKARARPDLVRQVLRKARVDGLRTTMKAVQNRLEEDMPLGYSAAGVVVEVGSAVRGITVGQRVATGGAGHAEYQAVAGHLAVPIPDGVTDDDAAFATVGAIAMHGLRLAELGPGANVCIVGLGLLGQITVRLAAAAGYRVSGIDLRGDHVDRACASGAFALTEKGEQTSSSIIEWSRGQGVDAVILTAATPSSDPARRSPAICRDRGTIVVVGDVGLELARTPFYEKELSIKFARSYGPGRYERSYEDWGVDYPVGHVRWTEGRNMQSFLDLLAGGVFRTADLVTHTFPFDRVHEAYDLLAGERGPFLGVELTYAETTSEPTGGYSIRPRKTGGGNGVGLIGAGGFARNTLLPNLKAAGFDDFVAVASQSGTTARHLAERFGFASVAADAQHVIDDPNVAVVIVATPHDSHARLVEAALRAGKHVFCEKPLALSDDELDGVEAAWKANSGQLMVGFNRRYSPAVVRAKQILGSSGGPIVMTYRVNAGTLGPKHWYHDRRQGGRLLGEVCHFVDTCAAIAQSREASVHCVAAGTTTEALLNDDLIVTVRYANGSLATISYGSGGHASMPKERLEILGRGHSIVIDDFRSITVDGAMNKGDSQDKGHAAEMVLLHRLIRFGEPEQITTSSDIASTRASLAAVASLLSGSAVDV